MFKKEKKKIPSEIFVLDSTKEEKHEERKRMSASPDLCMHEGLL